MYFSGFLTLALAAAAASAQQQLAQLLSETPELSTLNSLLATVPQVDQMLSTANGITILAPSNQAFDKFMRDHPDQAQMSNNPQAVTALLVQYAKVLEEEAHSNVVSAYVHRVQRHLKDLEQLPDWLASIPQRLISSITGSDAPVKKDGLHRDSFGFNKLAILATRRGRVYGLDIGNHGKVAWSSAAFAIPSGQTWDVKGIFVEDHRGLVTIRGSNGEQVVVEVAHLVVAEARLVDARHLARDLLEHLAAPLFARRDRCHLCDHLGPPRAPDVDDAEVRGLGLAEAEEHRLGFF
ncbi:hypothetical protein BN1723_006040 [Verticillium longisporum]|uniref:FAS1 domain-containing protein n=1 Tax=Verticillium longisporum TaxID=100787 RepID=A0A0G4NCJ7_VERLO|nr:hypothetical protein BN1723_006040 [Verticillium longisporum]